MNNKILDLKDVKTYVESRGFISYESLGLLQPEFDDYPFSPSAGHHVINEVILLDNNPRKVFKFSVVPDRSLRMYDIERIGISNRHLSFFESILIGYAGASEKLPKEEACKELFDLFKYFNLDPNRLLITCLDYAKAEGIEIKEDKTFYDTWVELLGKNKVKKTKGRRNLFYARINGHPGGTGCELYYKIGKTFVEIGSMVNYKFKFTGGLERTRNAAILQGFGLERLLMAIEEKEKISDISLIKPIKEVIKKYLRIYGEDDVTIDLYDESLTKIADSIRAILFIIHDCQGDIKKLSKSQRKILYKFKKTLNSEKSEINYLGIYDLKIYEDLVDAAIDIFKGRYPKIKELRETILEYIKYN